MSVSGPMGEPSLERHEVHNASVDESVAAAGACGQVHLPTGRSCAREHGHGGSCEFTAPDPAPTVGPESP